MELIDVNKESKVIFQHNAITSGRYDFSACMMDILFMVLASIEKDKLVYTINTKDIESITGRKWNITQFNNATSAMLTRMFEVETEDSYIQFVLFQYFKYLKGSRTIEVKLSDIALPYFFELKNNFTSMQLKSVLDCSSKYAKRLYALACQWRSVGHKRFTIHDLKDRLGLIDKKTGEDLFSRGNDFKKRVLDIAKAQINEHTDMYFDYELIKRGRSYYWVTLHFKPQEVTGVIDYKEPIKPQVYLGHLKEIFPEALANRIFKEVPADIYEKEYLNMEQISKFKNIMSPAKYLYGTLRNKGYLPDIKEK